LKRLEQALPSTGQGESSGQSEVAAFVSRDAAMMKRILELETALTEAGVQVPGDSQSTSTDRAKTNKRARASGDIDSEAPVKIESTSSTVESEVSDVPLGFGTLTIDPKNLSRFVGLSSGLAYLDDSTWGSSKSKVVCQTLPNVSLLDFFSIWTGLCML
jgi:hypothetical protein